MHRSFRHLTRAEIGDIIHSHNAGESQAELARRYSVDHSTIHYHLQKYEQAYPEQGGVYSVIKIQIKKTCRHPSSRCTLCGEMWDQIRRRETDEIAKLKVELADAQSLLRALGADVEMAPI